MEIEFDDSVIELVLILVMILNGARPMERVIQNVVENFSRCILEGKFNKGDTIFATVKDGKIVLRKNKLYTS